MAKLQHGGDGKDDVELEAFRRLYPSDFLQQFLKDGVRPDGRPLGRARSTLLTVGSMPNADGSAMVKLGNTTMLAGIKLEVMSSPVDAPDEGRIAVDFQMPAICSPLVRPGRQSELEPVITEQIKNSLSRTSIVDLRELSIAPGKAAWMAYLDVYCLNSDGSLLDAALLASAAALADLKIPDVAITDDGKVVPADFASQNTDGAQTLKNVQGKRLKLGNIPMALTCALHPKYVLPDPTAEEEAILKTTITILTDFSGQLVSFYKPGGEVLASTSTIQQELLQRRQFHARLARCILGQNASKPGWNDLQSVLLHWGLAVLWPPTAPSLDCISLAKYRGKELQKVFEDGMTAEPDSSGAMDAD